MKKGNPEPLTPELQAEPDTLAATPNGEIDPADMVPVRGWTNSVDL